VKWLDVRFAGTVDSPDGEPQPIYVSTDGHVCSVYCGSGRHAELLYREEPGPLAPALVQAAVDLIRPGLAVLDVQPAPEAPLPDGFTTAWLVTYGPAQPVRPARQSEAAK